MLRHHIPVIEAMRHQHRSSHRSQIVDVIASGPELVVVAGDPIEAFHHLLISHIAIAVLPSLGLTAIDPVVQNIDVLTDVSPRMPNQTMGTVVVVIRGVGCDGNDHLEPLDTGGRSSERDGAVVGSAGHSDLAGTPGSDHLFGAVRCCVTFGTSVEPIDDRLGSQRLVVSSDGRAALREPGPWRRRVDHGEAPRNPALDLTLGHQRALALMLHRWR